MIIEIGETLKNNILKDEAFTLKWRDVFTVDESSFKNKADFNTLIEHLDKAQGTVVGQQLFHKIIPQNNSEGEGSKVKIAHGDSAAYDANQRTIFFNTKEHKNNFNLDEKGNAHPFGNSFVGLIHEMGHAAYYNTKNLSDMLQLDSKKLDGIIKQTLMNINDKQESFGFDEQSSFFQGLTSQQQSALKELEQAKQNGVMPIEFQTMLEARKEILFSNATLKQSYELNQEIEQTILKAESSAMLPENNVALEIAGDKSAAHKNRSVYVNSIVRTDSELLENPNVTITPRERENLDIEVKKIQAIVGKLPNASPDNRLHWDDLNEPLKPNNSMQHFIPPELQQQLSAISSGAGFNFKDIKEVALLNSQSVLPASNAMSL